MTNEASTSTSASNKQPQKVKELEIKDKLRVLCLHGYRQNGEAFKSKLGSFRKQVAKYAELVFITAPHVCAPLEPGGDPLPEQRSWWANKDDGTFKGTNKAGPAYGFQESLRLVEDAWKTQGPFQGLMGFSQGACFVGLICGFAKKKMTPIVPEFAILASGFESGSLVHKSVYEETVTIPALHIYGLADDIISHDMSQALLAHFKSPDILEHSGGHYFPATAQQKQTYIHFFQDRLQEYLENMELLNSTNATFVDAAENDGAGGNSNSDTDSD